MTYMVIIYIARHEKNYMSYVLYEHLDGLLLLDDFIPPAALNFRDSEP